MRSFLLCSLCHSVALARLSFSHDDFVIVLLAQQPFVISAICYLSSTLVHLTFQDPSLWASSFISKFFVFSVLGARLHHPSVTIISLSINTLIWANSTRPWRGGDTVLCVCKYARVYAQTHVCVDVYGQRSTWAVFLSRYLVSRNRGSHWFSQMTSGAPTSVPVFALCVVLGIELGGSSCLHSWLLINSPVHESYFFNHSFLLLFFTLFIRLSLYCSLVGFIQFFSL